MQVVVRALFLKFGLTHWTPAAGYTYWAHAQGLVLAEISSPEIVALAQKPYLSLAESRHGPWSCRELGNPPELLSSASRTWHVRIWVHLCGCCCRAETAFHHLVVSSRYVSTFSSSP